MPKKRHKTKPSKQVQGSTFARYKITARDLKSPTSQFHNLWDDPSPTFVRVKSKSPAKDKFSYDESDRFDMQSPEPFHAGVYYDKEESKSNSSTPTPTSTPVIKPVPRPTIFPGMSLFSLDTSGAQTISVDAYFSKGYTK